MGTDYLGNNYITGSFSGTATFGSTTLTANGYTNAYLASSTPTGTSSGRSCLERPATIGDFGRNVVVDSSGFVYVTGVLAGAATIGGISVPNAGSSDIFLAKFDTFGNTLMAETFGGAGSTRGRTSPWTRRSGNIYLCGGFQQTSQFGRAGPSPTAGGAFDAFVTKLNAQAKCNGP